MCGCKNWFLIKNQAAVIWVGELRDCENSMKFLEMAVYKQFKDFFIWKAKAGN